MTLVGPRQREIEDKIGDIGAEHPSLASRRLNYCPRRLKRAPLFLLSVTTEPGAERT
jgi:hypothetical protein